MDKEGLPGRIFRFGVYECDPACSELRKSGIKVKLSDQPLRLLAMLLERPGKLVTREELKQRLWPSQPYGEFNDGLNTAVNRLRAALGDNADAPRFIETIPKRGYRFMAKAKIEDAKPDGESGRVKAGPGLWRWAVSLGPAFAVIVAAGIVVSHFSSRKAAANTARVALAVMPFQNLTGNSGNNYLSEGLTEEVTTRIATDYGGELRVITLGSGVSGSGAKRADVQVARELNAQYLLQGDVRGVGHHIRVAAMLIRTRDRTSAWADSYDGDTSQVLDFESAIAGAVSKDLSLKLLSGRGHAYVPSTFAAHDDYLRGLYDQSERSRDGFNEAVVRFAAATASDPRYADAYAELAVTYDLMGQYDLINPDYARSLGQAAAEQAIALDPSMAEAHAVLGLSDWFYRWDPSAAQREFQHAIELSPNNVDAHHWYSQLLMTSGRFKEADDQMQTALSLDPQSLILQTNLGWLYYFESRFPLAIKQMDQVIHQDPDFPSAHFKVLEAYAMTGDETDSWREFRQAIRLTSSPEIQKRLLQAFQRGGYSAALRTQALVPDTFYYGSEVDSARDLIFAGDKAEAMTLLTHAYETKEGWVIFVPFDPAFAPLHSYPQYKQLVENIKPLSTYSF